MSRTAAVLALVALAAPAAAQPQYEPFKVAVTPAAAPAPGLKYRLLPDPRALVPGNAATLYQRTLAMFYENQSLLTDIKGGPWDAWLQLPLDQWPRDEVKPRLQSVRHFVHEMDLAARRKECDWQLGGREEGVALLLPDIQGYRSLARVLAVQARQQLALGDFDAAAHTLQTGMGLGRHMSQGPILIQMLVGIAIESIMLNQVDAWVQTPNSPNLYWALTALPRPWADIHDAVAEDLSMIERTIPGLKRLDGPPMSPAEIGDLQNQYRKFFIDITGRPPQWDQWLGQAVMMAGLMAEAKEGLPRHGIPAERASALPAFQVAGLYAYLEYRRESEELLKWFYTPQSLDHPAYQEAMKRHDRALKRLDMLFSRGLLTALSDGSFGQSAQRVYGATVRTDRRIAALRCVEAVRLYAAANGGKLPEKLADVTAVPIPDDPATGKPFAYRLEGERATLDGPPPAGQPRSRSNAVTYEITVRK
jgi:hypothetical protein